MTQNQIRFEVVTGHDLDDMPEKSVAYLSAAASSLYSYLEVPNAIAEAKSGTGQIYQAYINGTLTGCFFLNFVQASVGRTMNLILLGGENLQFWAQDLSQFLHNLAEANNIDEFTALGRNGFGKLFPDLEHFACLYRKRLTEI